MGEAVNVGTVDSLNAIKKAQKAALQFKNQKPPVICYDWLICGNLHNTQINREFVFFYLLRSKNSIQS